ncbi:hypothetical protein E4P36_05135 [Streptomyces sp. 4R-3d]|nr:hypothetical protein E4P36_05135 [Streptomyces sp. 4R-3d]
MLGAHRLVGLAGLLGLALLVFALAGLLGHLRGVGGTLLLQGHGRALVADALLLGVRRGLGADGVRLGGCLDPSRLGLSGGALADRGSFRKGNVVNCGHGGLDRGVLVLFDGPPLPEVGQGALVAVQLGRGGGGHGGFPSGQLVGWC